MATRTNTDVSAAPESAHNVIQLALFGDPEIVAPFTGFDDVEEPSPQVAQVMADSFEFRDQLTLFLDDFSAEERPLAARGLYLDADGNPATRYRLLRAV